jgi:hypothetical protein
MSRSERGGKRRQTARPVQEASMFRDYPEYKTEMQYLTALESALVIQKNKMREDIERFHLYGGRIEETENTVTFALDGCMVELGTDGKNNLIYHATRFPFLINREYRQIVWDAVSAVILATVPDEKMKTIMDWKETLTNFHLIGGIEDIKEEIMGRSEAVMEIIAGYPVKED